MKAALLAQAVEYGPMAAGSDAAVGYAQALASIQEAEQCFAALVEQLPEDARAALSG